MDNYWDWLLYAAADIVEAKTKRKIPSAVVLAR